MTFTDSDRQLVGSQMSRKEAVLSVLRKAIIEGRLAPGARLDQDQIAESLGVSRTPVREALKALEGEGLVTFYPYRGVVVSQLRAQDIDELFAMRVALETLAVKRAVERLTEADISEMRRVLSEMDHVTDRDRWLLLNERFHAVVNEAAGWPRLAEQIAVLRRNVERYIRIWLAARGHETPQRQHWEILHACEARDADRAVAAVSEHLRATADMLIELATRDVASRSGGAEVAAAGAGATTGTERWRL